MKTQQFHRFQSLLDSGPLKNSYLVGALLEADRKEIMSRIVQAIERQHKDFFLKTVSTQALIEELKWPSLLSACRIFCVDTLNAGESEKIRPWTLRLATNDFVILGVDQAKELAVFSSCEGCAILDLLQEKPWERQPRILQDLQAQARMWGVSVDAEVFEILLDRHSTQDWSMLCREMDKMFLYAAKTKKLSAQDAREILAGERSEESWTLAEKIVFDAHALSHLPSWDTSTLLAILGQVRHFLKLGRQIAWGAEGVKSYQLQKFGAKVKEKGLCFFEQGLQELYTLEALVKSSSVDANLLFNRFFVALHAISSS